jgi:superfamily II DNA or RNA helicase
MRWLIDAGHLTDYRIFAPESDIDVRSVKVSAATGDFNRYQLREAAHRSHIVGDVVAEYQRHAAGKRGITFAVDVETSQALAKAYRTVGVPAESISAKTPDQVRTTLIDKFRSGELQQLVNVDIFGEGFDLPAIE